MNTVKTKPLKVPKKKAAGRKIHKIPEEPASSAINIKKLIKEFKAQRTKLEHQKDELQRTQKELEYMQQKYYTLFEQAPVGYLNVDRRCRILETNFAASNLLNIEKKLLVNNLFTLFIEKNYLGIFQRHINRIKTSGIKEQFEIKLKRKNNNSFWALVECTPNQKDGLSSRINLTITDITEHKQNQQIINYQALILEAANDAIIGYDLNYKITFWNRTAEKLYGYTAEEALGKFSLELLKPVYIGVNREVIINQLKKTGHIETETFRATKSGRKILIESHVVLLRNHKNELTGFIAIDRDITQHKQSEEELRKTRDYLDNLFNYANAPIICWDTELKITRFNHAFEKMTGYKSDEVLGKDLSILFSEETREESLRKIESTLNGKWEIVEIPIARKDGIVRIALWNSANVYAADGKTIEATIAQGQDITERKKVEEKIKQAAHRWQITFDSIPDMVSIQDMNFRLINVNKAYERIFNKSKEELIGKRCYEVVHNSTCHVKNCPHAQTLKTKKIVTREIYEPLLGIYLEATTSPLFDENNEFVGSVHVAKDITERKRAEAVLREREENLRAILDATKESIFMFDKTGVIVSANATAAERLNHTLPEIIGHQFSEFMSPELAEARMGYINKVFSSGQPVLVEDERDGISFSHNFYPVIENKEIVRVVTYSQDTTEHKKIEAQIRQLSRAVEQSPDSIIITNTKGNIEYVNPKFTEITQYNAEEVIGLTPSIFKSGYTKPEVYKNLWGSITKGKEWHGPLFNKKKNGELFWESVNISPIRDLQGNITHFVAIKEDITVSKKREEQLYKLNRTLNALRHNGDAILHAPDEESYMNEVCNIIIEDCGIKMVWIGIAENDENKTVRPVASAGFEEGYLQKLNVTWADTERGRGPTGTAIRTGKPSTCNNMLIDPLFKPWRSEAIKRGYASSLVLPFKTTEKVFGAITIYSEQPDAFSNDEINLLSELAEDFIYGLSVVKLRASHAIAVDELKKHRDHLEELVQQRTVELSTANEILKEAQEVAHIGNWRLDLTTNYLEWSDEVYRIVGIEPGSFGASLESFLSIVHPDDRSFVEEAFRKSVINKAFYNINHKIIRPDGEIRIVHEQCVTHYSRDEQPLYSLGVVQDITELKKIEEEIELHKTHLEELVKTRTEELNIANRKLKEEIEKEKQVEMLLNNSLEKEKELNELKSRFISTTSHEFRTPLASILSSMQLIQRYRKKWNDEKLEDQFVRIKTSIFNLTSLLDDILTISRADSGRIVFNPQKLNLYKYCMELYEEVKHKANKNHKFIFNCPVKEKEYSLDPKLIRFIIVNLLSNAFKYSPYGGEVVLGISLKAKEIRISVKDEGMGISIEDKKQLFKPFFRAKNTKDIEGTGLGLSIVQRAASMHNGEVKCYSTEGKGTRFVVKIPI